MGADGEQPLLDWCLSVFDLHEGDNMINPHKPWLQECEESSSLQVERWAGVGQDQLALHVTLLTYLKDNKSRRPLLSM